ncbi:hypothetical protein [Halegenticoccus soli]|uniref:hypothetical protein n=1 Tax=Halegenticoccus soli TaxID=1985678 RepID=UPI00117AC908|nr:hypothetical protein [Halegenticoccus soli]
MTEETRSGGVNAQAVQEAIDCVVREFGYPSDILLHYTFINGRKKTILEVRTPNEELKYELTYDGTNDENEPQVSRPVKKSSVMDNE